MKISRLITWNWGSLDHREWAFADHVLLTGESGSGKSTLLDAIQTVLTAAMHHVVQFNIGQDESTTSRRGGKEPRTLPAYALGQQADGVFLRSRATSYAAIVFEASTHADEETEPFTALVAVEAFEDGKKAVLQSPAPLFFLIRGALTLDHLASRDANGADYPTPLKQLYVHLQHRLETHRDNGKPTVQRFTDKTSYLQGLYGALMGKTVVSELDALRAAKSLVRAMAYKELGNVNDLVRDEILEPTDFSDDLDKMRDLMRSIANLKREADRLAINLQRLDDAKASASDVMDDARRFIVYTLAHAERSRLDTQAEIANAERQAEASTRAKTIATQQRATLQAQANAATEQWRALDRRLNDSETKQHKDAIEHEMDLHRTQFGNGWQQLRTIASHTDHVLHELRRLMALEDAPMPSLVQAARGMHRDAQAALAIWANAGPALMREGEIDVVVPSFDADQLDRQMMTLKAKLFEGDHSLQEVTIQVQAELLTKQRTMRDNAVQINAELSQLQRGKVIKGDAADAVDLIEREIPTAHPALLAQLVEPRPGTTWINAIEGYLGADRFAIIVDAGTEAACARLVKRHFSGGRSPKVVQGKKALEDSQGRAIDASAVIHELKCKHPIGAAFLRAQYGRVRKVQSEDELARTPQGLMEHGLGSRGYGMFSCNLPDKDLLFGVEARERRRRWCEQELGDIATELERLEGLKRELQAVGQLLGGLSFSPIAPSLATISESQQQFTSAKQRLGALDLSSIQALLDEQTAIQDQLDRIASDTQMIDERIGAINGELKEHERRAERGREKLPALDHGCQEAAIWAMRFVTAAPGIATEPQLAEEAMVEVHASHVTTDALRTRVSALRDTFPRAMREFGTTVSTYLMGARDESERFAWLDLPRTIDRIDEVLPHVITVSAAIEVQIERQRSIGLAENADALRQAEVQFNHVFTTSFCFKVRDGVKQGALTLQRLNRHLQDIRFGSDTFTLEWDWVPRMQKAQEFFEAVEDVVDSLEQDHDSIFSSARLTDDQRATADEIRKLLLAQDEGASERTLRELADYRNYRRYDIIRTSLSGTTRLSTWGTGSGGELETPFYVVRSAVLAHALGHFGRDRRGAPALRLMLSDEAFSKMDESRSRSVLRFLSQTLGLQLVVAMPTSKSGAVKPEFDKEFTFSKIVARRSVGGKTQELFLSDVQEKTLNREPLRRLWDAHAAHARALARERWEQTQHAPDASSPAPKTQNPEPPVSPLAP